jgi:hypothetical protein
MTKQEARLCNGLINCMPGFSKKYRGVGRWKDEYLLHTSTFRTQKGNRGNNYVDFCMNNHQFINSSSFLLRELCPEKNGFIIGCGKFEKTAFVFICITPDFYFGVKGNFAHKIKNKLLWGMRGNKLR